MTIMERAEMIRELRKDGYVVLSSEEVEAIEDLQWSATCGCGTTGIEEALRRTTDPREIPLGKPFEMDAAMRRVLSWLEQPIFPADLPPTLRP